MTFFNTLYEIEENKKFRWEQEPAGRTCIDSIALHGQVKLFQDWFETNTIPGAPQFACKGLCDCKLVEVKEQTEKEIEIIYESNPTEETTKRVGGTTGNIPIVDKQRGEIYSQARGIRASTPAATNPDGTATKDLTRIVNKFTTPKIRPL